MKHLPSEPEAVWKRLSPLLMLSLAISFVSLGAAPSPDTLLNQGDAALQAGDYTRAIELYEKAEPLTADPGRAALNLATAKYQRALRDGSGTDLDDAEQLFRCLLDAQEPRRSLALFGIGSCRLQKAGEHDAASVLTAIEAYEQCLLSATDETLLADARHNLERARLLLHQVRKAEEPKPPESGDGPNPNSKPKSEPKTNPNPNNANAGRPKPGGNDERVQADAGGKANVTDQPPLAGSGPPRPIPEVADQPLSAREALEHLREANERIWSERHQHRLMLAKPPPETVRDW